MLSQQAWNAFLKTLEEPPPRTIFVLATTEAQKVLPTVVDRCHRFDFGRPSAEQIVTVLERVATAEQIRIERPALALIARHATGSFRDALGTLEQLLIYAADRQIEPQDVLAVLGVADAEQLFEAIDAVAARDPAEALRAASRLAESGRDAGQVLRDLEAHGRELLAVQVLGEVPPELRVTAERDRRLLEQARALPQTDTVRLLDLVSAALDATANGAQDRIQLELALIKAATPEADPSTAALLARIERLEAGERRAPPGEPPGEQRAPATTEPRTAPEAEPSAPEDAGDEPAEPPPDPEVLSTWPAVVELVREDNAMLAALLEGARPISASDAQLTVAFPADAAFLKRKAEQEDHRRVATDALRKLTGRSLALKFELRETGGNGQEGQTLSGEELVRRFIEEFDAEELLEGESTEHESDEHEAKS